MMLCADDLIDLRDCQAHEMVVRLKLSFIRLYYRGFNDH
jgi:hypothetical protein